MKRLVLVALLAWVTWVVLAAPSSASEDGVRHGWSHSAVVPTFVGEAERVYVAADLGVETARAYIAAPGPVVLAEADAIGAPALGACPLTSPLVGEGERSGEAAPAADCTTVAPLTRGADGSWSVVLEPWPAHGVALVPVLDAGATFRVAFDTTKTELVPVARPTTTTAASPPTTASPPPPVVAGEPVVALAAASPEVAVSGPTTAAVALPARPVARAAPAVIRYVAAATPPALVVLPLVGAAVLGILLLRNRRSPLTSPDAAAKPASLSVALLALPLLMSEANVYKLGLVLIVLTAAIGLHLLVTWAGELSLAQAPLVGLPAFTVAKLSADHGISPLYLLPVAVLVGVIAGAVVGLPALRARGLQVALVTLAAGVAIDRFFFTREWVVGPPGGAHVTVPSLGPLRFDTARSLWPVLAAVVLAAIAAVWMIDHSKLGRGLRWVKAHPDAASAFGIPVSSYRTLAYAMAGGFAGLAGGLTAVWVQRMTPQAFPLSLSFTYLIIVALAGRGFIGGVAVAALVVEGGRLFLSGGDAFIAYAAPIGLILTLTRNQAGLNGLGRQLAALVKERTMQHHLRPRTIAGSVLVALGFAAIALAWYHAGNTDQVWQQNQELISGGIGGLALVFVGTALVVIDWLGALLAPRVEER